MALPREGEKPIFLRRFRTIGNPPAASTSGFDFTRHMRRACVEIVRRVDELSHVDMDRVAIRFCQAKKRVPHGLQASLTPLRFSAGKLEERRRGRTYTLQRLYDASGREMLYLLSFYLPRFLDRGLEEKLATIVHELWHISPAFDGDLRRHPGRCFAHGHSQKKYEAQVRSLSERLRAADLPPACTFLRLTFRQLEARYGRVFAQRIRTPRIVPVAAEISLWQHR